MTAFLANENIPKATVELLRANGHDVTWVAEKFPSVKDNTVLELARLENRILITFDRDYGELIYKQKLNRPLGLVYIRLHDFSPEDPANLILQYLSVSATIFDRYFSVLTEAGIRQRHL